MTLAKKYFLTNSCIVFLGVTSIVLSSCNTRSILTVTGSAYTRESGALPDISVIACEHTTKKGFDAVLVKHEPKIKKEKENYLNSVFLANPGEEVRTASYQMIYFALESPDCMKPVQTNAVGKYKIEGLTPGEYILFSKHDNETETMFWLEELTVMEDTTFDFRTSNAKNKALYKTK